MSAAHSARRIQVAAVPDGQHPPCEACGAPLDAAQRYCVSCGTRRREAGEPALEWVATNRRSGAVTAAAPTCPRNPLLAPALALLLLPAAVAGGVALANGRASDDQKLIDALRAQRPPVVTVAGGAAGTATANETSRSKAARGGKVLAHSKFGSVHAVTGAKPSASKVASDRAVVRKITKETGKSYLQTQKNLPDTIVVTKDPSSGSTTAPQGRGD